MLQAQREAFGLSYMHHSKLQNGGCALLSWPKSHTHIPGSQPYCSAFRIHKRTTSSLRPRRISQYSPPQTGPRQLFANERAHLPNFVHSCKQPGSFCFQKEACFICTGVYSVPPKRT